MNMNSVVNSLYQLDDSMSKQKTIEIKRVMRGALSMSRSTTGDNTFHVNKFASKGLEQQIKVLDKAKIQCRNGINSRKRTALRKWCLVFGKQKSMNDSIKELNDVLTKAIEDDDFLGPITYREELKSAEVEPEPDPEPEPEPEVKRSGMDPSQIRALMIRKQKGGTAGLEIKTNEQGITSMLLPKIDFGNTDMKLDDIELDPETPKPQEDIWPLKDTTWVNSYIKDQREKHDLLFTKNILKTIQLGMHSNPLNSFRLRAKLSDDPMDFLRQLTSAKTARPTTRNDFSREIQTAKTLPTFRHISTARSMTKSRKDSEANTKFPPLSRSKTMIS